MKKGFTLIELLAVIVILSVITLITVPMITNVIEESKKKALASSVQGLVESANLYAIEKDGVYEFLFDEEHKGSTKKGESLDYRGTIDGEGKLYLDREGNVSVCISNDTYYAYKNYNSGIIVGERKTGNCIIGFDALTNKYVAMLDNGTGQVSNVYSKGEVNNLVDSLDTKITNNTNEITSMKSNIEELQNDLNNYALQSELEQTNSNLNNLSSLVNSNSSRIEELANKTNNIIKFEDITIEIKKETTWIIQALPSYINPHKIINVKALSGDGFYGILWWAREDVTTLTLIRVNTNGTSLVIANNTGTIKIRVYYTI